MTVMKKNGGGNLEAAMALLIQNQAAFVSHMRGTHEDLAIIRRKLEQIESLLIRHEQILNELPEAIRQKVGFKPR